ncbi:PH domain-containing protein [Nocardiopsis trehalosi]|jgi:membrane protein YdbS with pleckstrin-like domain|uniref:PH domain-containing protein n=1 Tax=Nocardiopsis trehalosi TaxID=109329 RepID=UPI00083176C4|nr:PH domain-containing protein [Nocardiopsis trehalosi]
MAEVQDAAARPRRYASPEDPGAGAVRLRPPANRVERRAIGWWALRAGVQVAVAAGLLGALYAFVEPARPWLGAPITAVLAAGAAYTAVTPWVRYSVHRWETTDEAVYSRTGWWVREWRAAPISRIQTVDTLRGPFAQMLGLATLVVTTASARGAVRIGGLDAAVAETEAKRLTRITQQTPGDQT